MYATPRRTRTLPGRRAGFGLAVGLGLAVGRALGATDAATDALGDGSIEPSGSRSTLAIASGQGSVGEGTGTPRLGTADALAIGPGAADDDGVAHGPGLGVPRQSGIREALDVGRSDAEGGWRDAVGAGGVATAAIPVSVTARTRIHAVRTPAHTGRR
jgi:hypothetical protein